MSQWQWNMGQMKPIVHLLYLKFLDNNSLIKKSFDEYENFFCTQNRSNLRNAIIYLARERRWTFKKMFLLEEEMAWSAIDLNDVEDFIFKYKGTIFPTHNIFYSILTCY